MNKKIALALLLWILVVYLYSISATADSPNVKSNGSDYGKTTEISVDDIPIVVRLTGVFAIIAAAGLFLVWASDRLA